MVGPLPRSLSLIPALLAVLLGAGCPRQAGRRAPQGGTPTQSAPRDKQIRAQVVQRLKVVRSEESRWREGLAARRRLRESFSALPGAAAVGSSHKGLQFAGRQAGLGPVHLSARPTYEIGALLRVQPVKVSATGTWQAAGAMLARLHRRLPKAGVLEYRMLRVRSARRSQPDQVQLTARAGIFMRGKLPPAGGDGLPRDPIPTEPRAALRALEGRLIAVRAAIADGDKERVALERALALPREHCVPVPELLGPLAPLLAGVQPTLVTGDRHSLRIEGEADDDAVVERLRAALQDTHALIPLARIDRKERVPAGHRRWRTKFSIVAYLPGAPELAPKAPPQPTPGEAASAAPGAEAVVPLDRAPPPAPVVGLPDGAAPPVTGSPAATVPAERAPPPAPVVGSEGPAASTASVPPAAPVAVPPAAPVAAPELRAPPPAPVITPADAGPAESSPQPAPPNRAPVATPPPPAPPTAPPAPQVPATATPPGGEVPADTAPPPAPYIPPAE